jgi:hypothetical protein
MLEQRAKAKGQWRGELLKRTQKNQQEAKLKNNYYFQK